MKKRGRPGRAIICLNNAKVYDSIKIAAEDLNLDPTAVQRAAAGVRDRAGSFFFMYLDRMEQIPIDFRVWCDSELQKRIFWIEFGKEPADNGI